MWPYIFGIHTWILLGYTQKNKLVRKHFLYNWDVKNRTNRNPGERLDLCIVHGLFLRSLGDGTRQVPRNELLVARVMAEPERQPHLHFWPMSGWACSIFWLTPWSSFKRIIYAKNSWYSAQIYWDVIDKPNYLKDHPKRKELVYTLVNNFTLGYHPSSPI